MMAFKTDLQVKFNSVIKGYHAFRNTMNNSFTYKCIPDKENCFDKTAVLVKCLETEKCIGHVPATPVKINHAVLRILDLDPEIAVFCQATDTPQLSKQPWPEYQEKGGGAVIPVIYTVCSPNRYERKIIDILHHEASRNEEILKDMAIVAERSGEKTPPMVLSEETGIPDTPNYRDYTP